MRSLLIFFIFSLFYFNTVFAQQNGVSIGITKPDESAILHVQSDADPKGLLIPRYDTDDRNNINTTDADDPSGLVIYNTETESFEYFNPGVSNWERLVPESEILDYMVEFSSKNIFGSYAEDGALIREVEDAAGEERLTDNERRVYVYGSAGEAFRVLKEGAEFYTGNIGTEGLGVFLIDNIDGVPDGYPEDVYVEKYEIQSLIYGSYYKTDVILLSIYDEK